MKKIKILLVLLGLALALTATLWAGTGLAATCDLTQAPQINSKNQPIACTCPKGYAHPIDNSGNKQVNQCAPEAVAVNCPSGKVDPNDSTKCEPLGNDCSNSTSANACLSKNPITKNLNNIVNFLAAGIGVIVIGTLILGGIQYIAAGDNQEAIGKAKARIMNGLIALVAFLFTYAILQWLIPGGL